MKKLTVYLFSLIAVMFLSSCQSLYFTETQPKGNPHLSQIPETLWGNYLVMGETVTDVEMFYHVHKNGFVYYEEVDVSISIDSLDANEVYIKDSLLYMKDIGVSDQQNGFPFEIKNDTLYTTWYSWDEELLDDSVKITEDKGLFFMNMYEENNQLWECTQIEPLRNGDLLVWNVNSKKEEALMTKTLGSERLNPDSDDWKASPSRRQFRKFLKQGGFGELTHFLHKLDDDDLPELMVNQIRERN